MKIAVIGLGLIGASVARALAGRAEITGIDRDPEVVEAALGDGVITRGGGGLEEARGSEAVVIALPVMSVTDTARHLSRVLEPGTLVVDTGSTKARIVREVEGFWPCFAGTHPIAGKEDSGYRASQADLFEGKACIVTPGESSRPDCIRRAAELWEACGSRVVVMDPLEHDRLMAVISHMPHLLSFTSMSLASDLHIHRDLLGAGFRDFTRIAQSDPVMWRDIFLDNRERLLELLDDYVRELENMRSLIAGGDARGIQERLRTYSTIRRALYEDNR